MVTCSSDAPLSGLRIIEVSSFIAAPLGGMTLAQLGAEVIRINRTAVPPTRRAGPWLPTARACTGPGSTRASAPSPLTCAPPKASARSRTSSRAPSPTADLLTNASYPWLSYEALKETRPDLIHLRITGRHDGSPAVDYAVNAGIGFPLVTGDEAMAGPIDHVLPAWDVACGLYAAVGILTAERHRRRTEERAGRSRRARRCRARGDRPPRLAGRRPALRRPPADR